MSACSAGASAFQAGPKTKAKVMIEKQSHNPRFVLFFTISPPLVSLGKE